MMNLLRRWATVFVVAATAIALGAGHVSPAMASGSVHIDNESASTYDEPDDIARGAAVNAVDSTTPAVPTYTNDIRDVYDSPRDLCATNTADELLPGLPSSAPKPAGLGSTGRTTPSNLTEQLAMTEVRAAPGGTQIPNIVMRDSRWPAVDGWVKMRQNINGVEIHYVRNTITGAVDDFKFIGGSG